MQFFRHATGYNYQMYSSTFPGWVKIQLSYRYRGIWNFQNIRVKRLRFGRCIGKNRPMNSLKYQG